MFNYKTEEINDTDSLKNRQNNHTTKKTKFEKFVFLDKEGLENFAHVKFALLGISAIIIIAIILVVFALLTIYFYNVMGI